MEKRCLCRAPHKLRFLRIVPSVTDGSYEEQAERLPQEIQKLVLAVTLDDLKRYESPGRKAIAAARKTAKETANHNVLGRRRINADAEKLKAGW